ncbi:hypothetical protein HELRODRAFT_193600 [Helobdella robusta]|uniref:Structure-specific endonuclease subunit EME2 n=1 Tax=Helobdella robusta TaxID=6412 RepID=T1FV59_HELRO|nr:hypothetical protein HELRODRAFT_193600 [Helobdella robusta]ESN95246.1 hypothetical protein HELRODRAFT_193600 [Helobdella robusta]
MERIKLKNDFYSDSSDVDMAGETSESNSANDDVVIIESAVPKMSSPKNRKRTELQIERQLKKEKLEYEKVKKKIQQNEIKSMKPGECLKLMLVLLDENLVSLSCGQSTVKVLDENEIKHEVLQQIMPNMITFWRTVTSTFENDQKKFITEEKDVMQNQILVYIPTEEFSSMISSFSAKNVPSNNRNRSERSFENFILSCLELLGSNHFLTFVVIDWETYNKKAGKKSINHLVMEEALLNVQLKYNIHVKLVDSANEFARLIFNFTKAIAECPFKRSRYEQLNSLNTFIEGKKGCVKIGADGSGVEQTWRMMLMSFKNVSANVASAIMKQYPNPVSLMLAYKSCRSEKEGLHLLENILIRRGAGVTATTRKVGPELSRRLYEYLTSDDPNKVIS